jgi:hypothetical protein
MHSERDSEPPKKAKSRRSGAKTTSVLVSRQQKTQTEGSGATTFESFAAASMPRQTMKIRGNCGHAGGGGESPSRSLGKKWPRRSQSA